MRRLPVDRTLEHAIIDGRLRYAMLHALGDRLATCLGAAPRAHISPARNIRHFVEEAAASVEEFQALKLTATVHRARWIARPLRAFIARHGGLILARVREHRIVEGHGDLRPEHIWLGASPVVIDCLEFRRDLRLLDPIDELAFLSLECARLGAAGAERVLFERHALRTRDYPPAPLVAFHKAFRGLVRARLAVQHLRDHHVRNPEKWIRQADTYLAASTASICHVNDRAAAVTR
jgi:aminoglycoside phosphotransferase family enzyme